MLIVVALISFGFVISALVSDQLGGFIFARAVMTYLSIIVSYMAFYLFIIRYGFPWRIVIFINIFWIAIGVAELLNPEISEMFGQRRTTLDRGVTSLAPEPTYFAIYLFFSSWLMLFAAHYKPKGGVSALILLNITAILFLAKSTMGVLFVIIAVFALAAYKASRFRPNQRDLLIIGTCAIAFYVFAAAGDFFLEESRIARISSTFADLSILDVMQVDASINQRLEAVVLSLHGALYHNLIPAGLDTFLVTRDRVVDQYNGFFWYLTESNKIMSWIGAMVYELGVFGIAALSLMFSAAFDKTVRSFWGLCVLFILLLSAIPLSFPLVPMLLAMMTAQHSVAFKAPLVRKAHHVDAQRLRGYQRSG
ncbi:hypothetical protein AN191_13095 [Loktanella sp. 5RATIMAR09]|nr:hypothetical protein AN191_13095 [Loktanella sp. 5RATIMAR09]